MIKLDGKRLAQERLDRLAARVERFTLETRHRPRLDIVSVGDDPASKVYVKNKLKAGIDAHIVVIAGIHRFPAAAAPEAVAKRLRTLSADDAVDGIILQLPLPGTWSKADERMLIECIDPAKDVDGLTYVNTGRLAAGDLSGLIPCTPLGIMHLLAASHIDLAGKDVAILNRSNLVGKPLACLMTAANATVTLLHTKSSDLTRANALTDADIIVTATGTPGSVTCDDISIGQVLIDVSINRDSDGRLCGDFADDCFPDCYAYTPVPGGVGPMTVATLMENTYKAACLRRNYNDEI